MPGKKIILVINPGSTSTKISVFEDESEVLSRNIDHSAEELSGFQHIADQHEFRRRMIEKTLTEAGYSLNQFDAVVARGGLVRPIPGGTYAVNRRMLDDLHEAEWGEHASNLGALLAHELAADVNRPAFIVDPVVVDEMEPLARLSGIPNIERRSIFHALNQKAVARLTAKELGKSYQEVSLIVVHLGGGISVGTHRNGRVIDVNNALNGDGPFTPERAGGVPAGQLIELCFSGRYNEKELKKYLVGGGGMVAYLGTNDMRDVSRRVETGDPQALLYYEAMAYQVSKEIGACASVLKGRIDCIVLSGGLARDEMFVDWIRGRVEWIAPLMVYPGEEEMRSLALGALRVLKGEEEANQY
ncbi:MAG TPA: butyrate kinase [bacterium]|mgnify:CR=1 FL=1|nr:butyrate kinase [bacterium]